MKVFLIAGEASGDRLGGALMAGLRGLAPGIGFDGIGGAEMAAQGLKSRFPMDELSLMGIAEVLPKYRQLKRRIRETAEAVIAARPDALITIDSPDFCHRVARIVKARADIPIIHYVAPSVWAWRPGRAAKMAAHVDHVLALLPFEPPLMHEAGMSCDFVGHPVVASAPPNPAEVAALRADLGENILCVLPGSRRGEVARMGPIYGAALARLGWDDWRAVVPVAPGRAAQMREICAGWPMRPRLVLPEEGIGKASIMAASRLALATSGTVSLELAFARTPMVIGYDMAWLSRQIISRMVRIDTATLVNLVSETRSVPECIGAGCTPAALAQALTALRADPAAQDEAMRLTMARLGLGGEDPGLRAARSVLDFLGAQPL